MHQTNFTYVEPTYGYRSDSRLAASSAYGTYPGKNHLGYRNNECELPLLQSTANAFEMDWQPPINTALLPPPSPRRTSPTRRSGGSPPLCQIRSPSPQKGILKCRASPISLNLGGRPNLFDCPTSSSTLALVDGMPPNEGLYSEKNGLNNGFGLSNGFTTGGMGTAKKNSTLQDTHENANQSTASKNLTRCRRRVCTEVLRVIAIEFFALSFSIFLHYHIQLILREQLSFPKSTSTQPITDHGIISLLKIVLFALIDAAPTLALFAVFPTIHLNPVITMAHLFSVVIPVYICFAIFFAQICACVFCAFLLYVYLIYDKRSIADVPSLLSAGTKNGGNHVRDAYQMVFNQFLGTTLVVICHIRYSKDCWRQEREHLDGTSRYVSIFGAVWLSSFLSLTRSNVSWNPLAALTILVERFALDLFNGIGVWESLTIWRNHYVFWMGPILGALFGCILCRISITKGDKRQIFESTTKPDSKTNLK